jgi:uncharacterized protein (TIGR00730 family)
VVALNLDYAVLCGAAGAAVALERFADLFEFARIQAGDDAHRSAAAALTKDTDDAVVRQGRFLGNAAAHPRLLRQATRATLPNALAMARYLCVFCGAGAGNDASYAALARDAAAAIVRAGYGVVYGGGRIGLMGELADAALEAGGEVIGVIPRALADSEIAHGGITRLHVVESMHERKALMAKLSDAFVALPGGYGTMDEFCEILTWRQLGIHDKPIGLLNANGYYDRLIELFDDMTAKGFVCAASRSLFIAAPAIAPLLAKLGEELSIER